MTANKTGQRRPNRSNAKRKKAGKKPNRKRTTDTEAAQKSAEFEKACAKAEVKRTANRELRQSYLRDGERAEKVKHLLVKDLIRVFNHPSNPFRGSAASRDRYRQLGHYPELMVTDLFGNHSEFQRFAGLRDLRGTAKAKNIIAKYVTEQKIAAYAKENVLKHVGKFDKALREKRGEKTFVVMSDLHSLFLDPFAWEVAQRVIKMVDPDVVVLNGDVVDFPAVSRHGNMPGAGNLKLQDEIDFTRNVIFKGVREAAPNAFLFWHVGNHEHRLVRYLADSAPEICDLRCLQFDRLFGVDDFDIAMVFNGSFMAPRQNQRDQNIKRNFKVYYDCYAITHGTRTAKMASAEQMMPYGISGTSGHTHRPQMYSYPTLACPTATWMSTGMMAGFAVGQHYVSDYSQWTMGFGVANLLPSKAIANQVPVLVYPEWATFAGTSWTLTKEAEKKRISMWD